MKQITDNNFLFLKFVIPIVLLFLVFLFFFFKAIKSTENLKLIILTKIILGIALSLSLLWYLQIDFTELLNL